MYTPYRPKKKRLEAYIYVNAPNARNPEWECIPYTETNIHLIRARVIKRLTELYGDNWSWDGLQYLHNSSVGFDYKLAIIQEYGLSLEDVR